MVMTFVSPQNRNVACRAGENYGCPLTYTAQKITPDFNKNFSSNTYFTLFLIIFSSTTEMYNNLTCCKIDKATFLNNPLIVIKHSTVMENLCLRMSWISNFTQSSTLPKGLGILIPHLSKVVLCEAT